MARPSIYRVVLLCTGILSLQGIDADVGIEKTAKESDIRDDDMIGVRSLADFLKSLIMFKFDFSYLGMKFNIDLLESKPARYVHPPPIILSQTNYPGQPRYTGDSVFGPNVRCCDNWNVVNTRGMKGGLDTQIYVKKMMDANSREVVILAIQFDQNEQKHWAYYTQRNGQKPIPFKVV